jgi:VWFA-related protein
VLVNGRPAEIIDFSAHFTSPAEAARKETSTIAPAPHPTAPVSVSRSRAWLVYVDMQRTSDVRRVTAIRAARDFLDSSLRPGDQSMVAFFDGGALRVVQPLTDSREALRKALGGLAGRSVPSRLQPLGFQLDEEERVQLERSAVRALRDFVALGGTGGEQRFLLLVGGGYALHGWQSPDLARRLQRDYEELRDVLAASDITLHSVWAGGDDRRLGADTPPELEPGMEAGVPPSPGLAFGTTIATLARDTGGTTLVAAPDLGNRLEQASRRMSGSYSLALRTPGHLPGTRLSIGVRVAREGVRLSHRRLLRTSTDAEVNRGSSLAALLMKQPPNPWNVRVRVGRPQRGRLGRFHAPIDVRIPVEHLLFLEREGRHFAHLQFFFSVRDPNGQYTSSDPRDLSLSPTGQQLAEMRTRGLRYTLELVVPSGTTEVALTVADVTARTQSTTRFQIMTGVR